MSSTKIGKTLKRQKNKLLLLILYLPVSCSLIGVLSYYLRFPGQVSGTRSFFDVFWFYANPLNSSFSSMHLPSLLLSFAFLLLMMTLTDTPKPIISLFQIRVILLVLMGLITILVVIFSVLVIQDLTVKSFMPLFLFVDVNLILVFLLSFLPLFRNLKTKPL